jgi:hypothetical protein
MSRTDISLISLLQTGFVWSATTAWADVASTATAMIYPDDRSKMLKAKMVYAALITAIVVLVFYLLNKTIDKVYTMSEEREISNSWKGE